jgi:hypothetical protein
MYINVKKALHYFSHILPITGVLLLFAINSHAQVEQFGNIGKWRQPLTKNSLTDSRQLLRDYAVCTCIVLHKSERDIWRKDLSLSLLRDLGDYNYKAYAYIDSITKIFLSQMPEPDPNKSPNEQKGMLLACIDYYNSKELWQIIVEMDKYLIRSPNK